MIKNIKKIPGSEKIIQSILACAGGVLFALFLWGIGALEPWEAKTWDWRVRLMAQKHRASDEICLVLLDQNSLDWGRETNGWPWPWPREVFSLIIDYCKRTGARSLAMDVIFTEPSRFGQEDDEILGKSMAGFNRAASAVFPGEKTGTDQTWPKDVQKPGISIKGLDLFLKNNPGEFSFSKASFPIPEVGTNAAFLCNVNFEPDPDGIYRRIKPFGIFDNTIMPCLGIGAYLVSDPKVEMGIEQGRFQIGDHFIPIDSKGNAVLQYRGPSGTYKTYSAAAVIQSEIQMRSGETPVIAEHEFKDKYVFFGFSAPGLYDLRPSPVSGIYPGVEIHATMLDNLLSDDFISEIPISLTISIVFFLSALCAVSLSFFITSFMLMAGSIVFLVLPVLIALAGYAWGYWIPVMVCQTAVIAAILLSLAIKYATEGHQKRFIKNAFQQYISPAVIDRIIQNPEQLKLGGERRTLSIFFSDLESFTSISEKLEPEELTILLNEYLTAMTDIIIQERGTVDKYEGDAIIAFWNAPLDEPDHAVKCVNAALRCQAKLAQMRPGFKERIGRDLKMRIGINTGEAIVGNFGSSIKFDYTMLGDAVNLAARLEGTNKEFGTYTMISESTKNALEDAFAFRKIAKLVVVGRANRPVEVYEPMYRKEYDILKQVFNEFDKGYDLFYKGKFEEAEKFFASIEKFDPAASAYILKCRELINSPPENWQGIWVMTTK
ncbi:Nucleotide cyclase, CACHE domain-containing [Desulfonema limicola]|uniref:Nucleotide cyclase, CACHE domain-containing n=1 Tax=Desulfonema limicola TaxID=45656 RepID=A0A975GFF0_9BACT|nr:adenylate/guanylate cyclase domain-containing protein [Desulfonema limicola]QTA79168.1 Nucleotide cyclase, CACHE domain-containing [Desulfonema limicola]